MEEHGGKCLLIDGGVGGQKFCQKVVQPTLSEFGKIDIVVNNGAVLFHDRSGNETFESAAVINTAFRDRLGVTSERRHGRQRLV